MNSRHEMAEDNNNNKSDESESLEVVSENGDDEMMTLVVPLDDRVLEIVKLSENYSIQPVTLASALGISIDDATMELCGLLRAVGSTASFHIDNDNDNVETFVFPIDFETKARSHRRSRQTKATLLMIFQLLWKLLQIITAFGLVLSLLTVGIVAIAVLILSSRQQQQQQHQSRDRILHFIRRTLVTLQQLLWIYSINNHHHHHHSNSLLFDTLYAIRLGITICCSPNSFHTIYHCFRARRIAQRRQYATRGWSTPTPSTTNTNNTTHDNHQYQDSSLPLNNSSSFEDFQTQRGLLSILVEFLFGPLLPQTQNKHHDDLWKWKLREYIIVSHDFRLSLAQLRPFIDNPLGHPTSQIPQTLQITYHFHGKPHLTTTNHHHHHNNNNNDYYHAFNTQYTFSELQTNYTTQKNNHKIQNYNISKWQHIWFPSNQFFSLYEPEVIPNSNNNNNNNNNNNLPTYLTENYHALTKLSLHEFKLCSILGVINLIGVHWLKYTLIPKNKALPIRWLLKPFSSLLMYYSYLFIALPILRFLFLTLLNMQIQRRNHLRQNYAATLT